MCLGAPATGTYNCVPLTEDDASNLPGYINPELNSNLKRMIAVLSGKGLSRVPEWYCPVWDGNAGACTMPESGKIFNKRIGVERGSCEGSNCWACAAAEQTPVAGLITRPRHESNGWHAWGYGVTLSFNAEGTSATLSNPDFGDCEPTWTEFFIQVVASNVPVDLCSATTYFEGIAENLACDLWLNSGHSCDTKWEGVCAADHPNGADQNTYTLASISCTQCPALSPPPPALSPPPPPPSPPPPPPSPPPSPPRDPDQKSPLVDSGSNVETGDGEALSGGAIGGMIGGIAVFALVLGLVYHHMYNKRRQIPDDVPVQSAQIATSVIPLSSTAVEQPWQVQMGKLGSGAGGSNAVYM